MVIYPVLSFVERHRCGVKNRDELKLTSRVGGSMLRSLADIGFEFNCLTSRIDWIEQRF